MIPAHKSTTAGQIVNPVPASMISATSAAPDSTGDFELKNGQRMVFVPKVGEPDPISVEIVGVFAFFVDIKPVDGIGFPEEVAALRPTIFNGFLRISKSGGDIVGDLYKNVTEYRKALRDGAIAKLTKREREVLGL